MRLAVTISRFQNPKIGSPATDSDSDMMPMSPEVEQWADSLPLPQLLASLIPHGTDQMPLQGVMDMSDSDVDAVLTQLQPRIRETIISSRADLKSSVQALEKTKSLQAAGVSKFECFTLTKGQNCGSIHDFLQGLGHRVGHPIHDIMKGMKAEHCKRGDSKTDFVSPNYSIQTCSDKEWRIATDFEFGEQFLGGQHNRRIQRLQDLMAMDDTKLANLTEPEVVAIVLYTGPMYVKYNTVLRRAPAELYASLDGNLYTNTIHALVSGVMKLQRVANLPHGLSLFRGLGKAQLHEDFFTTDEFGNKGMMEFAFMSTTKSRHVALQYSGVREGTSVPTVLSMECGTVDRAASIQMYSQFPGEEEFLWVPMSYVEPTGRKTLEVTEHGIVSVVHVRTNANLKCFTVDELRSRRKELHIAMLTHNLLETKNELDNLAQNNKQFAAVKTDLSFVKNVESIKAACEAVLAKHQGRQPQWYNDDDRYREAVGEALEFSGMARDWLELWVEDDTFASDCQFFPYTLLDAHRRHIKGRVKQCLLADGDARLQQALALCRRRGFVLENLDEKNELGETPLMRAAAEGNPVEIQFLLLAGADINQREDTTGSGYTPLIQAAYGGHALATRELVEAGADVNMQCIGPAEVEQGWAALHFAVYHAASVPVVQCLLQGNADVNLSTAGGQTALGFAEQCCLPEIAAMLRHSMHMLTATAA